MTGSQNVCSVIVGALLFSSILIAGCASVCVPVHVQTSYPQHDLNACAVIIENTTYPLAGSDCRQIKNNATNWLSFDDTNSSWKGIDHVCKGDTP